MGKSKTDERRKKRYSAKKQLSRFNKPFLKLVTARVIVRKANAAVGGTKYGRGIIDGTISFYICSDESRRRMQLFVVVRYRAHKRSGDK